MKLPKPHQVIIDARKIREYLLSQEHPVGRFKAVFFQTLGFDRENWQEFSAALKRIPLENEAEIAEESEFGRKLIVRGRLVGPTGRSEGVVHSVDRPQRGGESPTRHRVPGVLIMEHKLLDTVVLTRDLPEKGLRAGDLGAVVEVYEPDGLKVEFVTASGLTGALVTLRSADLRPVDDTDLIAVRTLVKTA